MNFPNEYHDCESGKEESSRIMNELLKKYEAKPASKRVNYLKNGFLNPFYCPFNSILSTNEEKKFFVLRNFKFLTKLKNYFYNTNNQKKIDKDKILADLRSTVANFDEVLNHSFINVRLAAFERGTVATFSQIYALKNSDTTIADKNLDLSVFQRVLNSVKKKNEKEVQTENKVPTELIDEKLFNLYHDELNKTENHQLIGFVINSKFSLVNGQCSANASIKTNMLVEMIFNQQTSEKLKNTVLYRTPTSVKYNLAKINHFYI